MWEGTMHWNAGSEAEKTFLFFSAVLQFVDTGVIKLSTTAGHYTVYSLWEDELSLCVSGVAEVT